MKIITGQVTVAEAHWRSAQALAESHSRASRREPGCLSHDWFPHPTRDFTLFFFEQWRDQAAIDAHFGAPTSIELVTSFRRWATGTLELRIHDVGEVREIEA